MPEREHTSKHYEQQLRELKNKLLLMSHKAEQMISDSIRSLVERRPSQRHCRQKTATGRDCREDIAGRGAVGRSEGSAASIGNVLVRRATTTFVHCPGAGGRTGGSLDGRTGLGAGSDLDGEN